MGLGSGGSISATNAGRLPSRGITEGSKAPNLKRRASVIRARSSCVNRPKGGL
jgi:hypothetical protein